MEFHFQIDITYSIDYFEFPVINVEYALLVLLIRITEGTFFQINMKVVFTSSPSINVKIYS